jgi:hypothetical protein
MLQSAWDVHRNRDARYGHFPQGRTFVGKNRQRLVTVVEGLEVKELLFASVVDQGHVPIRDRPTSLE